ncbi:MAG: hypothetical protein JSV00_03515 [bacterium]|nr:MAG: hypothetical protein JSV00_03515 [bacterium]
MAQSIHLTVVGTRFPQLALATLMAKRGKRVLVVDALPESEGSVRGGTAYTFRKRPAPLFGMDSGGFLRKFLDEIGIGRVLVNKAYPPNPVSYQVVLPRHRLNVYPDRERFFAEVGREFPSSLDTMRELYGQWDEVAQSWLSGLDEIDELERGWSHLAGISRLVRGLMQTRKVRDHLRQLEDGGPVVDFLTLQHHFLGAQAPNLTIPSLSASLIHHIGRRGTFKETLGTRGLTELTLQRFHEYGGEIVKGVGVSGLDLSPRGGLLVRLTDGREVNSRTMATTDGIAAGITGLLNVRNGKRRGPAPLYPIRFYLAMDEKVVPVGMEDDLFMMRGDEGGPLGIRALYMALGPTGSEGFPAGGRRTLTVTALAGPGSMRSVTPEFSRAVKEDLLKALEAVIPFLDEGLESITSDIEPGEEFKTPRPLGTGVAAWDPGILGRTRIRKKFRGKAAIISPPPWELGIEGEALAAIAVAGSLKKILGQDG